MQAAYYRGLGDICSCNWRSQTRGPMSCITWLLSVLAYRSASLPSKRCRPKCVVRLGGQLGKFVRACPRRWQRRPTPSLQVGPNQRLCPGVLVGRPCMCLRLCARECGREGGGRRGGEGDWERDSDKGVCGKGGREGEMELFQSTFCLQSKPCEMINTAG